MMTENPETRAKILEWPKRYQIEDGDPALALLELINIVGVPSSGGEGSGVSAASSAQISEAIQTSLLPAIERLVFQSQELQNKLSSLNLEEFSKHMETYHEGIDYCTKKLDVVKKESENLIVKIEKASASIKPITTGAVLLLMAVCGVLGYILSAVLRFS